jgi:transposase
MERPMSQPFDASRSLTALEQDSTIIAAMEIAQSKWLVAAVVRGIKRQPLKKLDADEEPLLKLLYRWRKEADQAGHPIRRVVVAYEAGRDGFWLARWSLAMARKRIGWVARPCRCAQCEGFQVKGLVYQRDDEPEPPPRDRCPHNAKWRNDTRRAGARSANGTRARICGLRHSALETAVAFERMAAALSRELRELIDDGSRIRATISGLTPNYHKQGWMTLGSATERTRTHDHAENI